MSVSRNEVGHALNVASFEKLIISCRGLGRNFNPVNPNLQVASLGVLLQSGKQAVSAVANKLNTYSQAVARRQIAFADVKPLCTRIVAALVSCGVDSQTVQNAKSINKKVQGNRTSGSSISQSHQSYTQITGNFAQLVDFVSQIAVYQPNEADLQAGALAQKVTAMETANTELMNAEADLKAARTQRNEVLYNETTGLVATGLMVKEYAKSLLSAKSAEYKAIQAIGFRSR